MKPDKKPPELNDYVRAGRLPFLTASVFPFIAGSCIAGAAFSWPRFFLGLLSVIFTHCGANLINDYADSESGVDWQDKKFYVFFGGSKLIQEGVLAASFYRRSALACWGAAGLCIAGLLYISADPVIIAYFLFIAFLGFSYSHRPLQFSYRRSGEAVIFILFGPAVVMGAYYIQTGIFPAMKSFLLSLPFGFFTTAILFSNEIPDYEADIAAGKYTWVSLTGKQKAYVFFYGLMAAGFISVMLNIAAGNVGIVSFLSFIAIVPALKAGAILRCVSQEKEKFMRSSQLVIMTQALVSLALIAGIFL